MVPLAGCATRFESGTNVVPKQTQSLIEESIILVGFAQSTTQSQAQAILSAHNLSIMSFLESASVASVKIVGYFSSGLISELEADPAIRYVELNNSVNLF